MGALRVVFLSAVLVIIAGVIGCSRYEEKTYTGKTSGDLAMNFSLTIRNFGEDFMEYDLRLQPADNTDQLERLRKKWHDEAKLKLAAYEKMQQFCEINYVEAVCKNIGDIKIEMEKPEINSIYTVRFYDKDKNALFDLQGNISHQLDNQATNQHELLKVPYKISRVIYNKIAFTELQTNL